MAGRLWFEQLEANAPMLAPASFGSLVVRNCPLCGDARRRLVLGDQYYSLAALDVMAVVARTHSLQLT